MNIYLGIDGGGSHTRAILVNAEGCVLGTAEAGPSNYHNVGLETATANILEATRLAAKSAEVKTTSICAAYLGCAAIKSSLDASQLRASVETAGMAPAGNIRVENDLWNALAGGLNGRPGIAIIAGTGSHCAARDPLGNTTTCGGWGWMLDDAGSAMGLTLSALRMAVRSADGRRKPTRLLEAALAFLGLSDPGEMLAALLMEPWSPDQLGRFAPVVVRCAQEGDAAARRVLRQGARALAELAATAAKRLSFPNGPEIVLLGGCARSGDPYQPLIEQELRKALPNARLTEPEGSPLQGAAVNVIQQVGLSILPSLLGGMG